MNNTAKIKALTVLRLILWAMEYGTPNLSHKYIRWVQNAVWTNDTKQIAIALQKLATSNTGKTEFELSGTKNSIDIFICENGATGITVTRNERVEDGINEYDFCYDIFVTKTGKITII